MKNCRKNKTDRRSIHDRRVFSYDIYFPERRVGDRRQVTRRKEDRN